MPPVPKLDARPSRGRPAKLGAVIRAARRVFGREGYTRASIAGIAAEADVSTRTLYNHFSSKQQLFETVLLESATAVAEALEARMDRHLLGTSDVAGALTCLGREWSTPLSEFTDHFAIVRQISAEAEHIPREIVDAWRMAGPERVERSLAAHMEQLATSGALRAPEPMRAAVHYIALVTAEVNSRSLRGAMPLEPELTRALADAGVQAFLRAYAANGG